MTHYEPLKDRKTEMNSNKPVWTDWMVVGMLLGLVGFMGFGFSVVIQMLDEILDILQTLQK